jgi:hypothetical protein
VYSRAMKAGPRGRLRKLRRALSWKNAPISVSGRDEASGVVGTRFLPNPGRRTAFAFFL